MSRKYIPRLVIEDVPASDSIGYTKRKVEEFREKHQDFDNYLIGLNKIINDDLKGISKVLRNDFDTTIDVIGKDSIFNILVKLYNYQFSLSKTCEYLQKCKKELDTIFNSEFEIKNIQKIDDQFEFEFKVVDNNTKIFKDYSPLTLYFKIDEDNCCFELVLDTDVETIEDGYHLFYGYSLIFNKVRRIVLAKYWNTIKCKVII